MLFIWKNDLKCTAIIYSFYQYSLYNEPKVPHSKLEINVQRF